MAVIINQYGHEHAPKGYKFPAYSGIWMAGVGFLFWKAMKGTVTQAGMNLTRKLTNESDSHLEKEKAARQAAVQLNKFLYFVISAYWGWVSLRDSAWLPGYLGGHKEGSPAQGMKNFPFIPQVGAGGCNCYILFTFGYHINELIDHLIYDQDDKDFVALLFH